MQLPRRPQVRVLPWVLAGIVYLPLAGVAAGPDDYVTIEEGTLPLILTAPHDGTVRPEGVPVRQRKDLPAFVTVRDTRAAPLTLEIAKGIERRLGHKPHVVLMKVSRRYVDANRAAGLAYESDVGKAAYDAFHGAVRRACEEIADEHGTGLLVDVHGQKSERHAIIRGTRNGNSMFTASQRLGLDAPRDLSRRLESAGFKMLPPPSTNARETMFTGGYITTAYGQAPNFAIDAVQLEFGSDLRAKVALERTGNGVAEALATFLAEHYLEAEIDPDRLVRTPTKKVYPRSPSTAPAPATR